MSHGVDADTLALATAMAVRVVLALCERSVSPRPLPLSQTIAFHKPLAVHYNPHISDDVNDDNMNSFLGTFSIPIRKSHLFLYGYYCYCYC